MKHIRTSHKATSLPTGATIRPIPMVDEALFMPLADQASIQLFDNCAFFPTLAPFCTERGTMHIGVICCEDEDFQASCFAIEIFWPDCITPDTDFKPPRFEAPAPNVQPGKLLPGTDDPDAPFNPQAQPPTPVQL